MYYRPCIYLAYNRHILVTYTLDNWHILVYTFCFQGFMALITHWPGLRGQRQTYMMKLILIFPIHKQCLKTHVQYVQAGRWWVLVTICPLPRSSSIFIVYTIHMYWIYKVYIFCTLIKPSGIITLKIWWGFIWLSIFWIKININFRHNYIILS